MTPQGPAAQNVFVSYRRTDAGAPAGRITDRLRQNMPDTLFFFDVESIVPGDNWRSAINRALDSTEIMLVIIGPKWRGNDTDRLTDINDVVRYEIVEALRRKIRIIPVLVDGALMPGSIDLPECLVEFANKHAAEVRHSRFNDDVQNLSHAISTSRGYVASIARKKRQHIVLAAFRGAICGFAIILIALILCKSTTGRPMAENIGSDGASVIAGLAPILGAALECRRVLRRATRRA